MNAVEYDKEKIKGPNSAIGLGLGILALIALNVKSCIDQPTSPQPALLKGKVAVTAPAAQPAPKP